MHIDLPFLCARIYVHAFISVYTHIPIRLLCSFPKLFKLSITRGVIHFHCPTYAHLVRKRWWNCATKFINNVKGCEFEPYPVLSSQIYGILVPRCGQTHTGSVFRLWIIWKCGKVDFEVSAFFIAFFIFCITFCPFLLARLSPRIFFWFEFVPIIYFLLFSDAFVCRWFLFQKKLIMGKKIPSNF